MGSMEAGALDREIDMYFDWEFGNLSEALGRKAFEEKVAADEARKARNAKRAARRKARKLAAESPRKPRRRKA